MLVTRNMTMNGNSASIAGPIGRKRVGVDEDPGDQADSRLGTTSSSPIVRGS